MMEVIVLVCALLFAFSGNARGALLVAISIPFSLLVASIYFDVRHVPASLLALGALDLGMTVDGAVALMENVAKRFSGETRRYATVHETVSDAAREGYGTVLYAAAIVLTGYMPISALSGPLGRVFRSMALSEACLLLGMLVLFLILAPVLRTAAFPGREYGIRSESNWHVRHRWSIGAIVLVLFAGALYLDLAHFVGSEFLAQLDDRTSWTLAAGQ